MKVNLDKDLKEYKKYFKRGEEKPCLVTKFLVDEECIEISNVVLTQHSEEFYGKDEIFLLEFSGQIDKVYDVLELLHGHDVEINVDNMEVIAKFALFYKCEKLISTVENWLEDSSGKIIEISALTKLVFKIFQLGHTRIIGNSKIRDMFSSNAEMIAKDLVKTDGLFFLHLIFNQDYVETLKLPPISDKVDTGTKYMLILGHVNQLIDRDPLLVGKMQMQLDPVFDKGVDLIYNRDQFRQHIKTEKRYTQLKQDIRSGAVVQAKTALLTGFNMILARDAWKMYDWKDVLSLKNRSDVNEFQYFDIVVQWCQNQPENEPTKENLLSSVDAYMFPRINHILGPCCRIQRYTLDHNCGSYSQFKWGRIEYSNSSSQEIRIKNCTLICHDEKETVLKSERYETEVKIKNVNGKPQAYYITDENKSFVHLFLMTGTNRLNGLIVTLTANTYKAFVDWIMTDMENNYFFLVFNYDN